MEGNQRAGSTLSENYLGRGSVSFFRSRGIPTPAPTPRSRGIPTPAPPHGADAETQNPGAALAANMRILLTLPSMLASEPFLSMRVDSPLLFDSGGGLFCHLGPFSKIKTIVTNVNPLNRPSIPSLPFPPSPFLSHRLPFLDGNPFFGQYHVKASIKIRFGKSPIDELHPHIASLGKGRKGK